MFKTEIISAFPGTGKTYYCKNHPDTSLDSDSSSFSWIPTTDMGHKVRNPDFPKNYIEHIKNKMGTVEYIFVSSHKEVRDALIEANLPFTLVVPHKKAKQIYLDRYARRGSTEDFIKLIDENWDKWIDECLHCYNEDDKALVDFCLLSADVTISNYF